MFHKPFSTAIAFLMAASLVWAGGDPWKSKPYQQWDEKDLRRIFNDSPWAKVVQIPNATATPSGTIPPGPDPGGSGQGSRTMMGGQTSRPSNPADNPLPQTAENPQAAFVVRWASSRTIREAAVRAAILKGQFQQADAAKELAQTIDTYQVLVAGPDMKAFQALDEASLKGATVLQLKRSKEKLAPSEVKFEYGPDGRSILSIIFSFPKKSANGEPAIAASEKSVDFSTAAAGQKIGASFDLTKMEDSQGRDL
jgi:hypothetical protein